MPATYLKCSLLLAFFAVSRAHSQAKIDRFAVVERHRVQINRFDTLGSLTIGNGKFAFTVDATGLQSFPTHYENGVPLGTQSEWGWHSFPNSNDYQFSETLKPYDFNNTGANALYAVSSKKDSRSLAAIDYFRQNPHRLQLGNFGLEMIKKNGAVVLPQDLEDIHQELDPWTGIISSKFSVEGVAVQVITCADANKDIVSVKINSELIAQKRLKLKFRFPYPTGEFADKGTDYSHVTAHTTTVTRPTSLSALFSRKLDADRYYVLCSWSKPIALSKTGDHTYALEPTSGKELEITVNYSAALPPKSLPSFTEVRLSSVNGWKHFWESGAAIDLAGSPDPRAQELERRIILSQYLTRVQCAGNFPPQETGLTYNSWYGKPHMEMYWWHTAHYALWGRSELMEKSMQWYFIAYPAALEIAKRQGYKGARWQKMTDHTAGEAPSSVGSFLIWQQPHLIYQAELLYRNGNAKQVLQKYSKLLFATADFMASFATYDSSKNRYNLGKGIIPAQECYNPAETFNSPYELAYWKWALQVAQQWRQRMGLGVQKDWQRVIDQLAIPAQKNGVYSAAESVADSYSTNSKFTIDHPAVLAAFSTLPQNGFIDTAIMNRTYDTVGKVWHWDHTWGWDFPLVAMTATRLNRPSQAIDALFRNVTTNTYLVNGHNYQNGRLTIYLPGNGGLLSAIALMCAGSDDNKVANPGFPKNGQWNVRWEGLQKMP